MSDVIEQVEKSSDFEIVWRIPFERENSVAMQYAMDHVRDIVGGDCWAAMTRLEIYYSFYTLSNESDEYKKQRQYRDHVLLPDISLLFESPDKVFLIMGGNPFRYATIEYTEKGLGIITDYQCPE